MGILTSFIRAVFGGVYIKAARIGHVHTYPEKDLREQAIRMYKDIRHAIIHHKKEGKAIKKRRGGQLIREEEGEIVSLDHVISGLKLALRDVAAIGQQVIELLREDIQRDEQIRKAFPKIAEEEQKAIAELQRLQAILKQAGSTIVGES